MQSTRRPVVSRIRATSRHWGMSEMFNESRQFAGRHGCVKKHPRYWLQSKASRNWNCVRVSIPLTISREITTRQTSRSATVRPCRASNAGSKRLSTSSATIRRSLGAKIGWIRISKDLIGCGPEGQQEPQGVDPSILSLLGRDETTGRKRRAIHPLFLIENAFSAF